MEVLVIFLSTYGAVNLFGVMYLGADIAYSTDKIAWHRYLIFPMVWERLRHDLNITGSIIAISLFVIGLLPAIVLIYITGLFYFLVGAIVSLFKSTFKRRD